MDFKAALIRAKDQFLQSWSTFSDEYKWKVISVVLFVLVVVLFLK